MKAELNNKTQAGDYKAAHCRLLTDDNLNIDKYIWNELHSPKKLLLFSPCYRLHFYDLKESFCNWHFRYYDTHKLVHWGLCKYFE